jgi:hypothetical protein
MTVSAFTIIRAVFQSLHRRRSQTQKIRSAGVSFSRLGAERRRTISYCRKARFSSCSWAEVLNIEVRAVVRNYSIGQFMLRLPIGTRDANHRESVWQLGSRLGIVDQLACESAETASPDWECLVRATDAAYRHCNDQSTHEGFVANERH